MMKKILLSSSLLLLSLAAVAVPAKRITRTVVQADGDTVRLTSVGDEFLHYFVTSDQVPVVMGNDGRYYYAAVDGHALVPSAFLAHSKQQRKAAEVDFLTHARVPQQLGELRRARQEVRAASPQKMKARKSPVSNKTYKGQKKGLVILVNFADNAFSVSEPLTTYTALLNDPGYNGYGMHGSVRDYFHAQSQEMFDLSFDVVGPVQLSQPMAYYGKNDRYGNDVNPVKMIVEACDAAALQGTDFKQYDWDGDSIVDQVFVVYAGYGEAQAQNMPDLVWPHMWSLDESDAGMQQYNGIYVNNYACSCELSGSNGSEIDGIGTICHEFSHCLGLPDFYDTNNGQSFGMDAWSLMDYGCYNDDCKTPCNYTAYERWFCGWHTPVELDEGCTVTDMTPVCEGGNSYIIYNQGFRDEFYMLENKQCTGWDSYSPGHGMLVTHVDYKAEIWDQNTVNNIANHNRCTIVPADNIKSETTLAADPFPGTKNKTELTNTTLPKASLYNANADGSKLLNRPIENIAETSDGLISFDFNGGKHIAVPRLDLPYNVAADGFSISWSPVPDADSYTIRLTQTEIRDEKTLVLSDSLKAFVAASDGSSDIATKLDSYTEQPGWTGFKVYKGKLGAKIGSSTVPGFLATPTIDFLATDGKATVCLTLHPYKNDVTAVAVKLIDADGKELSAQSVTADGNPATVVLDHATVGCKVSIVPEARAYLELMEVYDGADVPSATPARLKAEAQECIIEGVTETCYTFARLTPGLRYICQVKSINETEESPYSAPLVVCLDSTNAIDEVMGDATDAPCELYDLCGRKVTNDGMRGKAKVGLYVKRQGGKVTKVMVR